MTEGLPCIINSALCDVLTGELQKFGVLTLLQLARIPSVNLKETGVIMFLYNGQRRVKLHTPIIETEGT